MKYIRITFILLVIILSQQSYGQCAGKEKGSRAEFSVELFLTLPDREEQRTETGATAEPESSIKVVETRAICYQIESLLDNASEVDNVAPYEDISKYFYETQNFYYAFWAPSPEFDDIPRTGPKRQFVVIKKDFSQYWKYYF